MGVCECGAQAGGNVKQQNCLQRREARAVGETQIHERAADLKQARAQGEQAGKGGENEKREKALPLLGF
jgi:hypothetical protein